MAYVSELKNGSDLNSVEIPGACRNDEVSVNPDLYVKYECMDASMDDNGLRELFDQVLSFFLKEESVKKNAFRPFPPKLGDGVEADLFKLFLTVKRIGSYELVSKNNMWEFVAKECGFEIGLEASLKLLYIKYLKELDQWLIEGGFKDNIDTDVIAKLDLLSHHLDEYICFESNQIGKSLCHDEIIGFKDEGTSGFNQNEGGMDLDVPFSRINGDDNDEEFRVLDDKRCELSSDNVVKKVGLSVINDDDDKELSLDDEKQIDSSIKIVVDEIIRFHSDKDVTLTAENDDDVSNVVKNVSRSSKRKREKESLLLSEMVDWVANAARNPHSMTFKTSQRSSKWKKYTGDKLWKQALLSRKALFAEISFDSGNEAKGSSQKKNQRMHPAMYEDDNRVNTSEIKVCCKSATSAEQCTCTNCNLRTSSRTKRESGKFRMHENTGPPQKQKHNVGPLYQAVVPAWTGVVTQSDPKWLGTQMWPPPDDINTKGNLVIGLGRQNVCDCECLFKGSAECVRFHIAENRYKLKLELGDLFYKWRFNQMGEEVSLSWEPEEEKVFKSLVIKARHDLAHSNKSRHEIMNKFWKRGAYIIRDKSKQNLVSYYFNVFVLRRRSYQNRVTPKDIDSDNDEEEVGSVGDRFGYEKIHGLLLKCSENMQCRDLES
ncbi:AT-rich interactive domain-containing protein 1 [Lactuca sativa]|uniref:ARID domain-containing protein n=1 Tax=Lactuca sativa TaxID=4236 RepID=A0A9R1X6J7_LACSA|nr:AT-rich interactive domain-containing protein 1 [Lactuca sativa]XP_042751570.1 AT-rich interactive domain-containing protein 1 [Lactuca sativa]KAJ0200559.1 hypothetical protein LSAT_V11C600301030 [Lactuca sativa]